MATQKSDNAPKRPVEFPCHVFKQGTHQLVLFLADAKRLYEIVSANELIPDKEKGYQRIVSPSRRKTIASFIDAGNALPLSVLISFDKAKLSNDKSKLIVENVANAGWIIDGQHRLAGAHSSQNSLTLPVVAFLNLPVAEQIKQFVTINREQVGVPTSLYYELLSRLPQQLTEKQLLDERATDLAKQLRRDSGSAFFNRIVLKPNAKVGQISTTNFVRKVAPFLKRDGGCLFIYTDEERKKIIDNLYHSLRAVYQKEYEKNDSVFFRTIGFGALMNALPTLLQMTVHFYGGFTVEDIVKVFKNMTEWVPVRWRSMGTGSAAEKRAGDDLITLLYQVRDSKVVQGGTGVRL